MLAPGILVWFKPTAGSFAIWAVCSGFASVIRPTRSTAFMWAAWSLPYAALTILLQFSDDDQMPILARFFLLSTGTLGALLIAVLPLTALLASDRVEIPQARASDS